MAQISIPKNYEDGTIYFESDVDDIRDNVLTFVNTTKFNNDNLQEDGITASDKLLNNSITTAKIQDNAVTTVKIADKAVSKEKIELRPTTTDGSDPGAGGISRSASVTTTFTSGTLADVTGLSTTLTVEGGPVLIALVPVESGTNESKILLGATQDGTSDTELDGFFYFTQADNTIIAKFDVNYRPRPAAGVDGFNMALSSGSMYALVDDLAAGTYTIKLRGDLETASASNPFVGFYNVALVMYEL